MNNGWQTKKLGDLLEVQNGYAFSSKDYSESGHFVVRIGNVQNGYITLLDPRFVRLRNGALQKFSLSEGDILVSLTGNVGRVGVIQKEHLPAALNQRVARITIRKGSPASREFLILFLYSDSFREQLTVAGHGAAQQNVSTKDLVEIHLPVPGPPEQRRIVGILDEAFEGIATAKANAEKNLQNVRALFETFLNIAIQGRLIPQDSQDTSVTELASRIEKARDIVIDKGRAILQKTQPIETRAGDQGRLPNSWKWAQLESLTIGISDGVHKKPQYASKGVPFITVKNLTAGPGISFEDLNYITLADHKEFIKRTHPEKGDILITKDGTIGVVRLIETDVEFSIFVSVALIKPVMKELGPYLVYALRASSVQSQIVPQGAALKHLYLVDLRRLAIPLPPLAEQKRIVARLDSLKAETQRLESIYQQKLTALERLRKSLLHHAFAGNL